MKLTGSYKLNVKKNVVWKALNDASILKECIPGCESFEKENDIARRSLQEFGNHCSLL